MRMCMLHVLPGYSCERIGIVHTSVDVFKGEQKGARVAERSLKGCTGWRVDSLGKEQC